MDSSCLPPFSPRLATFAVLFGAGFALTALTAAPEPAEWKFEVLHLKNGQSVQGLLLKETDTEIRFQYVRRNPGVPTVAIMVTFQRDEVARIERLGVKDREVLEARLKALDPTGNDERVRTEKLKLRPVPWGRDDKGGLKYTSAHFVLVSNARQDIIRLPAVRLEQIYAAYARFLPPRHAVAQPTTILLVRSLAEYQALLKEEGRNIFNPAFYDAAANRIVCASDLQRLD